MSRYGPHPTSHPRNPWSGGRTESVSSSGSSLTYHVIPPNHYVQVDPRWEAPVGCPHVVQGRPYQGEVYIQPHQHQGMPMSTPAAPTGVYLVPKMCPPRPHHFTPVTESAGRRSRPLSSGAATPVSGGYGATETAVLPCGGHCIALETFCHHLLQVAFVAGILTGMCLIIAGSVLKGQGRGRRGPDLSVLTYIGAMVSLVSGLLLAIQCCSRPRPRPRRFRTASSAVPGVGPGVSHALSPPPEEIPLQPMQPLMSTLQRHQQGHIVHDPHDSLDCRGVPWWRRENDYAA